MPESNIAWFGLLGAIVGAIPALIGAVVPWVRDRDRIATEKRTMELAKLEVEFVSAWIDAASKLSGGELDAREAMARARLYRLLGDGTPVAPRSDIGSTKTERGKGRIALLTYLGFYCFMIFGASIDDSDNVSLSQLLSELRAEGGVFLVLAIPAVVLFVRRRRSMKRVKLGHVST